MADNYNGTDDPQIDDLSSDEERARSRKLRAQFREIADDVVERQDELIQPASEALIPYIDKANDLLTSVKTACEATADSKTFMVISGTGRKKVQELRTESNHFSSLEFADKLQAFTTVNGGGEGMSKADWVTLGQGAQSFFKHPPTYQCLFGSFAKQFKQKAERVRKQRVKDDNSKDKATNVTQIVEKDGPSEESTASDVTKRVLPALIKLYDCNKRPIDYFEFVVDPDSFGATIENMFHVSFLVRDGYAEIKLDEDGLPSIRPTIYGLEGDTVAGREQELENMPRKQVIEQISMAQWRELCTTFRIKKVRIPTRRSQPTKESSN